MFYGLKGMRKTLMKVLILGGTGAMGKYVTELMSEKNNVEIYVTSRTVHDSCRENVHYILGNAKETTFIEKLLETYWDAIIDFMVYSVNEFSERIDGFLKATAQYVFVSSARVYAESEKPLTESSDRLVDVCSDKAYLDTEEYALFKAREEDILCSKSNLNWTILRPYITYDDNRLQLGVFEKEKWLFRVMSGKKIVFDKDMLNKKTSLTYGYDVAKRIVALIGNKKTIGEIYQIAAEEIYTWKDVLDVYSDVLRENGYTLKTQYIDNIEERNFNIPRYQVIYDRKYDRVFDCRKIKEITGIKEYTDLKTGIRRCISNFLKNPSFIWIDWKTEAIMDKFTGDRQRLSKIHSGQNIMTYIRYRYLL